MRQHELTSDRLRTLGITLPPVNDATNMTFVPIEWPLIDVYLRELYGIE